MADFCKQCSIDIFGEDHKDLAGIADPDRVAKGYYPVVVCEGCGIVQVDHEGKCVSGDCLKKHKK